MIDNDKLKEYAADLLPVSTIAILLDVEDFELLEAISDKSTETSKVYHRAKSETIAAIRKQEVELAKAGSPLAIENVGNYIIEQTNSENG